MIKVLLIFIILIASGFGVYYIFQNTIREKVIKPVAQEAVHIVKPLEKYSFKNLRETQITSGITIGEVVKEEEDEAFISRKFYFTDGDKKVSGLMNLPREEGTYPVIVLFRGFVPKEDFTTGEGTRRTGEEFAKNGFITLAPDFLGYGESDMPSKFALEERFQTYTTALSLFASLPNLNTAFEKSDIPQRADREKVGLWGHSNGGHIALAYLTISGSSVPTVLWAPVTKPFPYSILYFTDEYDDEGKGLRKLVADFEKDYDVFDYTFTKYIDWIKAPLQLHQGSADDSVPQKWSDQFDSLLTEKEIEHEYFVYPGEDHNFNGAGWPEAVQRSVAFYNEHFSVGE